MQSLKIRRASAEDARAIAQLEAKIFPDAWGEGAVLSYIDTSFVAECDGSVIAYMLTNLIAPEGELDRRAVSEECRRTGIGKALLSYAISSLIERGISDLYLEVREKNLPARALYTSLGFRECGVRRSYYKNPDDNAILMVYNL